MSATMGTVLPTGTTFKRCYLLLVFTTT